MIFIFLFIAIIITGLTGSAIYNGIQKNYTLNEETVTIKIPNSIKDEPEVIVYNAAFDLQSQGIIDADTFRFKFERTTGWKVNSKMIKGGYYTIPPKTHYKDLLEILGIKNYD